MLTDEDIAAYLQIGNELRAIEFKGNRDAQSSAYIAKVARACLAMSNQRDGGHIILGVIDSDPLGGENGLTETDLARWSDQDWTADKINRFADPPLALRVEKRHHPSGGRLVVIEIAEFSHIPTLCKKDNGSILKMGQIYTRSIRKPESSSYHSQSEVRELLDLAVSKGLRRYIETGRGAGVDFGQLQTRVTPFQEQLSSAFSQPEGVELITLPHFRYTVHPQSFEAGRLPYEHLRTAVNNATVLLRGWPFPSVRAPSHDRDFIYEISVNGPHKEGWAMFTSGLFVEARPIGTWPADPDNYLHNDEDERVQGNLPFWLILLEFTEALEFATRLRENLEQEEPMVVKVEGFNLRGQRLVVAHSRRSSFFQNYIYDGMSWESKEYVIDDDSYINGTRAMAVEATRDLLVRFGFTTVTPELLTGIQEEAFRR